MLRSIKWSFSGPVMSRIIAVWCIAMFAGNAVAASSADEAFEALAEQFISDLPDFSPVNATLIGDHSADDVLDQVDANARTAVRKAYAGYLDAIAAIDRDDLSRANQVDAELLQAEVESSLWSLDTLQEWAWNPLMYVNLVRKSIIEDLAGYHLMNCVECGACSFDCPANIPIVSYIKVGKTKLRQLAVKD